MINPRLPLPRLASCAALLTLLLLLCHGSPAQSVAGTHDFYKTISIDTNTLSNLSLLTADEIIHTGLPARPFAFVGAITGYDTANVIRQSAYVIQMDEYGANLRYDEYEDQAPFVFSGPRTYAMCYDGGGVFYIALASNGVQLVLKVQDDGTLHWARAQNHHESYGVVCDQGSVHVLGQDESQSGGHDFSLARIDANGGDGNGTMFGTVDFEVPEKAIAAIGGGYLMVGSSSIPSGFLPLLIRADAGTNLVWQRLTQYPGVRVFLKDVEAAKDGSGYYACGYSNATQASERDSVLLMKLDTAGTVLWTKLYGDADHTEFAPYAMSQDDLGNLLIAGAIRDTAYRSPFTMRIAPDGSLLSVFSFDDQDPSSEEFLKGIAALPGSPNSLAIGERVRLLPNFQLQRDILLIGIEGDQSGCGIPMNLGTRNITLVDYPNPFFTQPYQKADTMQFGHHNGSLSLDTLCFVPVGIDPAGKPYALGFRNPASDDWALDYSLPEGGATATLIDLQGRSVLRTQLPQGNGRKEIQLQGFAPGIYLLQLTGEGWTSDPKRVLLIR